MFCVGRVLFKKGSAVEGNSKKTAEGKFEAQNGVQVTPGGQFGRPNGVQVDLGGQLARARWCLTAPKWSSSGAWRAVEPQN